MIQFLRTTTKYAQEIIDNLVLCENLHKTFIDDIVIDTIEKARLILGYHPYYEFEDYYPAEIHTESMQLFKTMREDYYKLSEMLGYSDFVIKEFQNISQKNENKDVSNVSHESKTLPRCYIVTLSPPKDIKEQVLVDFVKRVIKSQPCQNIYGVFEKGAGEGFHTHYCIQYSDRFALRNSLRAIKKLGWIFKIDNVTSDDKLLQTLRYFHQEDKDNYGFIGTIDFYANYLGIEIPVKFKLKEKSYSI